MERRDTQRGSLLLHSVQRRRADAPAAHMQARALQNGYTPIRARCTENPVISRDVTLTYSHSIVAGGLPEMS